MGAKSIVICVGLILIGCGVCSSSAYAQNSEKKTAGEASLDGTLKDPLDKDDDVGWGEVRACKKYEESVEDHYIDKGKRENNLLSLRIMYARCPYYDPYSENTLRVLIGLHEKAKGDDPKESLEALRGYKELLRKHTANLEVLQFALDVSKEDSRFGNQDFFRNMIKMLRQSIKSSVSDGTDPSRAIPIFTLSEQRYILSQIDGTLEKNEIIEQEGRVYSLYDFLDGSDHRRFTVFFDLTTPMAVMKTWQAEAEKREKLNLGVK